MEKEQRINHLLEKYNINLKKLEKEQIELAKNIDLQDKIDFTLTETFAGIDISFIGNKILCCVIVCNKELEIIDRTYVLEKTRFPYISGFRNYRELPAMILAIDKLKEKPDIIFIPAQGITHPRLGLASHLSISTGIPTIGVSNILKQGEINNQDILREGKKVGKILISKKESKPLYISPGSLISIESAYKLTKSLIVPPHKRPEPIHLAAKYTKEVRKEII